MKTMLLMFLAFCLFAGNLYPQLYSGPAQGSVASGVTVNTDSYTDMSLADFWTPFPRKPLRNKFGQEPLPDYYNTVKSAGEEGSNLSEDISRIRTSDNRPILMNDFEGFYDGGSWIPPDPHCAVGPQHFIAVDNKRIKIWEKSGTLIKTISADDFYNSCLPGADVFDNKVLYDHFYKRWIMVWLHLNESSQEAYYMLSVSDDSIPTGTWYNWALPSDNNGTTDYNHWGDYQGVGFDNQAIYLTSNHFSYPDGGGNMYYQYSKIRIIGTAQLYNNTAGSVTWNDLWNVKNGSQGYNAFGIRPSIIYGNPGEYYFLSHANFTVSTYVTLYKLVNPLTSPSMTAVDISVTTYRSPYDSKQLGSSTNIDCGSTSAFRCEPVYRGGYLWAVHPVRYGTAAYSAVGYIKLSTSDNTVIEDYVFGGYGSFYSYPAISVDKDMNTLISYSRSDSQSYISAYYTSRLNGMPSGEFTGSQLLKAGEATYVKTFGGSRNRWGDYNGSWLDPVDENIIWVTTEYAESPVNNWGMWNGQIRLVPYDGPKGVSESYLYDAGLCEVGTHSDTLSVILYNYGTGTLSITDFSVVGTGGFHLSDTYSYPINVDFRDSVIVKLVFSPDSQGTIYDSLRITSNDYQETEHDIPLKGQGYNLSEAFSGVLYAAGSTSSGGLVTLNSGNGSATTIGATGFADVKGITIHPTSKRLYGLVQSASYSTLIKIEPSMGTGYEYRIIPGASYRSIAFDNNADLYISTTTGMIRKVDLQTGDTTFVGSTGLSNLQYIAINPLTDQLYGLVLGGGVYKINKSTGASNLLGSTGFGTARALTFDNDGILYGMSGGTNQPLYRIDTTTGAGTLIGNTGKSGLNALAVWGSTVDISDESVVNLNIFSLSKNYPNPFNPSTTIKYTLGKNANVSLKIYNALGQEVRTLLNEQAQSANKAYEIVWDGKDNKGHTVSSGIYLYRIEAGSFVKTRKMMLLK